MQSFQRGCKMILQSCTSTRIGWPHSETSGDVCCISGCILLGLRLRPLFTDIADIHLIISSFRQQQPRPTGRALLGLSERKEAARREVQLQKKLKNNGATQVALARERC
jgi:hypothetical protein